MIGAATDVSVPVRPLLSRRTTWYVLLAWAVAWGTLTWALEAAILLRAPEAPDEPWHGVYRLVETVLWIIPLASAIHVAERWPITLRRRHWRRIAAQIALGLALGPAWGMLAYGLSPYLMPWWRPRGMWGIIGKEAKAMLFGYGTTALLAQVALRIVAQRRAALAFAQSEQRAAEVQLDLLRLELQPDGVLQTMDAVRELIARDVDSANAALVLLADSLDRAMDAASVRELPLAVELANIDAQVRLRRASGWAGITYGVALGEHVEQAPVPRGILQSLVEEVAVMATATECDGLHLHLGANRQGRALRLTLAVTVDPTDAIPALVAQLAEGRALIHARERLRLLHGEPELPSWRAAHSGDVAALRLMLPWPEAPRQPRPPLVK